MDESSCSGNKMYLRVVLGVTLVILGCLLVWKWFPNLMFIIKGCLGLVLVFFGLITLAIAKE